MADSRSKSAVKKTNTSAKASNKVPASRKRK
jgi:hypothetical protein